ncbi:hypothetical protein [Sediminibacterium soli]|uniref:hypothetical protein n=1 Tax=Sediminibacterium soli TaxID=2698829 RepID=UPI00137B6F75|nr:hypothetical protein [Sediminibacterium soli]NCI45697.1 hypothetical protein [Sediminibacterium soli]
MKHNTKKWLAAGSLLAAAITFCAWRAENKGFQGKDSAPEAAQDTLPSKKHSDRNEFRSGDLDHALQDIDRAMQQLNREMKLDMGRMEKEIRTAMEEVKKIDLEKIHTDLRASLKEIDWTKTRGEVDRAMRQAEQELKKVDMEQVKKNVEKAMEQVNTEQLLSGIDFDKIHQNVTDGMAHARTGLEKAKKELTLLKEFLGELEKDGLIDSKKAYKIEIKDREMYINGTRQSKEVNDKYRKYFKDEDYTIKNDGEGLTRI